jgi:hypothetical protein
MKTSGRKTLEIALVLKVHLAKAAISGMNFNSISS